MGLRFLILGDCGEGLPGLPAQDDRELSPLPVGSYQEGEGNNMTAHPNLSLLADIEST